LAPLERFLFLFATTSEKSRVKMIEAHGRMQARAKDRDKETTMPAIKIPNQSAHRLGYQSDNNKPFFD
jgi:hypothetical protein